jgi:hypothetical protein
MHEDRELEMMGDMGYIKGRMESLDAFIRGHMEEEERKIGLIHKWLMVLSSIIVMQWLGYSGPEILAKLF